MDVATGEAVMNTVIRKIGNSEGVILPKDLLQSLNLKAGDSVVIVRDGDELRLRRVEDSAEEFERKMKIARERMKKYETVYRALAK
jgi:putative addiction module antidote